VLVSVVGRGFERPAGFNQNMKLVLAVSSLSTHNSGVRAKTGLLEIRIVSPSGETGLLVECCFNELAL
jgi:hypothetical protein